VLRNRRPKGRHGWGKSGTRKGLGNTGKRTLDMRNFDVIMTNYSRNSFLDAFLLVFTLWSTSGAS